MSAHAFVDETMRGGYYLASAVLLPADLAQARKSINALILPGQRRIHFSRERDSRRREIITSIAALKPEVVLYDGSAHGDNRAARRACLESLVDDLAARGARRLVIEQDDSIWESDRRVLFAQTREVGCGSSLTYLHQRAHEECLLAIPDAVAWCWTRGGQWRGSVRPIVADVRQV